MGGQQTVLDSWSYTTGETWGSQQSLTAGQQVPITIEYYDAGGPASMILKMKGPGLDVTARKCPSNGLHLKLMFFQNLGD